MPKRMTIHLFRHAINETEKKMINETKSRATTFLSVSAAEDKKKLLIMTRLWIQHLFGHLVDCSTRFFANYCDRSDLIYISTNKFMLVHESFERFQDYSGYWAVDVTDDDEICLYSTLLLFSYIKVIQNQWK